MRTTGSHRNVGTELGGVAKRNRAGDNRGCRSDSVAGRNEQILQELGERCIARAIGRDVHEAEIRWTFAIGCVLRAAGDREELEAKIGACERVQ